MAAPSKDHISETCEILSQKILCCVLDYTKGNKHLISISRTKIGKLSVNICLIFNMFLMVLFCLVILRGRRELGPETNSDHLPWRIRPTSWENSAHNPGEFGSTFEEFGLLLELNNLCLKF